MTIEVMSRVKAIEFALQEHNDRIAVVSISDPDKASPELLGNSGSGIFRQLKLHFADVDVNQTNCITDEQAHNIAGYILEARDNADRIIVHCEAGMSRSAGVAAAIMKFLTGSDFAIFDSPRYRPNMTCYRKVLNAFYDVEDE